MPIDIIGGGIGGLTLAVALKKLGINFRIFEQAKSFKPVGAGIILANNAMQVYDSIGLKEILSNNGNPISEVNIVDKDISSISSVDLTSFEKKYNVKNTAIHRAKLIEILVDQIDEKSIFLGHKLDVISKDATENILQFENGKEIRSKLVIGADGIHSKIRKKIFPDSQIRSTNQVCWRGVTEHQLPTTYQNQLNEAWGNGRRFGFVKISSSQVYWYALDTVKKESVDIRKLSELFQTYNPLVSKIIRSTPVENIHTDVISDLKPLREWHKDQICLMGDAAHGTTPNMGQGACQSIEDAYVLSKCLKEYSYETAFSKYQKLRITKANGIIKNSRSLGEVAHWTNPLAVSIRNALMKITPKSLSTKQSEKIFAIPTIESH